MNRLKAIGSAFLMVPALALVSTQARAEYKCNEPQTTFDRTACEKAKQSPDALRQYIQLTRGIHSLQFSDYVSEAQARAWLQAESDRTAAKKAPVQSAEFWPENPGA
jgi:uncharacterized protein YecT (DUF1311 family)